MLHRTVLLFLIFTTTTSTYSSTSTMTTATATTTNSTNKDCDANKLEDSMEAKGVEEILAGLTEEERSALPDKFMPLRHFRAEKVSGYRQYSTDSIVCFTNVS